MVFARQSLEAEPATGCSLIYGRRCASAPLVTVGVPTYRRPQFLLEALRSALAQQLGCSFEVVVVDNDQSRAVLDVAAGFPPERIVVYQNSVNLGISGSLNRILELARGEWMLFLPDDDLLLPGAISSFTRLLSHCRDRDIACLVGGHELQMAGSRRPLLDLHDIVIHHPFPGLRFGSDEDVVLVADDAALVRVPMVCSSFFRRQYLLRVGGWDAACSGFGDVALYARVQADGKLFACRNVFSRHRAHEGAASGPNRQWGEYPISSAERLLCCYVSTGTVFGMSIRRMLERQFVTGLWKRPISPDRRSGYARELMLSPIVVSARRRLLLRNLWLLTLLAKVYSLARPLLGRVSQALMHGVRKASAKAAD